MNTAYAATEHYLYCNYNFGRGGPEEALLHAVFILNTTYTATTTYGRGGTALCGLDTEYYLHCSYDLGRGGQGRHWFMRSGY